jgi:hypothetical protein
VLGVPRSELEHGFGASTQETFNAGVREGLRRAVDAISRLALEVVVGRQPSPAADMPIMPADRVLPESGRDKRRRAKE